MDWAAHVRGRFVSAVAAGEVDLPLPGQGGTLERWRRLAAFAAEDVCLVKLVESHADAVAIGAELGAALDPRRPAAVWAAEPPGARVDVRDGRGGCTLHGTKAWCSGAAVVRTAMLTGWRAGEPVLVLLDLDQPRVSWSLADWHAVGMSATGTATVELDGARGEVVGPSRAYLERPGFWHGGAGLAACWYGATLPIAERLMSMQQRRPAPHAAAHLGSIDVELNQVAALLRQTAGWIDRHPSDDAEVAALRVRSAADFMARRVLERAMAALGPGPLCTEADLARRVADLPVFIRQSHAERDLAALAERLASHSTGWAL
jgi:hypothetical protein